MGTEIWDVEIPKITIRCDDASLYTARIAPFPDTGREATGYKTGQFLPEDRWAHLIVMRFLTSRPPDFYGGFFLFLIGVLNLVPLWADVKTFLCQCICPIFYRIKVWKYEKDCQKIGIAGGRCIF